MTFVPSLPVQWAHLQDDDDPVRAAAEAVDPSVRQRLFHAWGGLSAEMARFTSAPSPYMLRIIGQSLSEEVQPIAQDLLTARYLGAAAMGRQIVASSIQKDFSLGFHFNRLAAPVADEADKHAARFVREIGEDTRSTLAAMVQRGVAQGLSPRETAQLMRDSVGLTISQATAVQNYRRLLETGSPEAQTRALRDERFDISQERLAQLTSEQIDVRVNAYRRRYVMYRATMISRYETLQASNAGAMSAVKSAIKVGALPPTTVKTWKIAKDEATCRRCRSIPEIQPAGVGIDQPFAWQAGKQSGEINFAPLHPNCRCTNGFRANP